MHLMLHILKKDIRRLRWGIVVALLLQACVTIFDATQSHGTATSVEVLLILLWEGLIAMAVYEDPLVGDRQFWVSRPFRWPILLGAKLLFAGVVMLAPTLVSDIAILAARGFHPWEWIPQLLWKQLALLAAVALPVIALAAVLQNFAYLALAIIAMSAATFATSAFVPTFYGRWVPLESARFSLFFAVIALAAGAILYMQFARRFTWRSRMVGLGGFVAAQLVLCFLSPMLLVRLRAAVHPAQADVTFRPGLGPKLPDGGYWSSDLLASVSVPVQLAPLPQGLEVLFDVTSLELQAPDGRYDFTSIHRETDGTPQTDLRAPTLSSDRFAFQVRRPVYNRLKDSPVELKATVVAALFYPGEAHWIPIGSSATVGAGQRCFTDVFETVGYTEQSQAIVRVSCESPAGFPFAPSASLWDRLIGDSMVSVGGMAGGHSLLSPLDRMQTSIPLGQVSESILRQNKIKVTSPIPAGWTVVHIDVPNIRMGDYGSR